MLQEEESSPEESGICVDSSNIYLLKGGFLVSSNKEVIRLRRRDDDYIYLLFKNCKYSIQD